MLNPHSRRHNCSDYWNNLAQCSQDNWRPVASSEATLGKTLGYGDWQLPDHSVIQQPYSQIYMISVTTIIMSLKPQLIQHSIRHLALYCSQQLRYYATTVAAAITLLWSLLKQPLIRPNDLNLIAPLTPSRPLYYSTFTSLRPLYYSKSYIFMIYMYSSHVNTTYIVTTTITSLRPLYYCYSCLHDL